MTVLGFDLLAAFRSRSAERNGYELYGQVVRAARDPWFYGEAGVPDTLDGRFDMVGLHAFLLIRRLTQPDMQAHDKSLSQAVFDAMFNDMDVNLREMGVGDMSVGKKVRAMWEAFHGRSAVYAEAMALAGDERGTALTAAIARNVWRGGEPGAAGLLARIALAQDEHLTRLAPSMLPAVMKGAAPLFRPLAEVRG